MADKTPIQWTDHTFNGWYGCRKVAPECENCYIVDTPVLRSKGMTHGAQRALTSDKNWGMPARWDRKAQASGERAKVFCLSLGDWLDDEVPAAWLARLLGAISITQWLDWQLLTKRPKLWRARLLAALLEIDHMEKPEDAEHWSAVRLWIRRWLDGHPPANVWVGVSAGADQLAALNIPAKIHFLSCEPMLYPAARYPNFGRFDWVILGGESGPHARPVHMSEILRAVRLCQAASVPVFVKQMGANAIDYDGNRAEFTDSHGGNAEEWPHSLRVRQFPHNTKAPPAPAR